MPNIAPIDALYAQVQQLRDAFGDVRLRDCTARAPHTWPQRGLYLFFEDGELRGDGHTPRIVRVGTHGVAGGTSTSLWGRLRTHRGPRGGAGGSHRSSIFRHHVGTALLRAGRASPDLAELWAASKLSRADKEREKPLEAAVSTHIGAMRVLWLDVNDEPGPRSERAYLERNLIRLLSGAGERRDSPSSSWLGLHAGPAEIRTSGLWNIDHVAAPVDPDALTRLTAAVRRTVR